jgi:calcium-dependent protein kinase
VEGGELFDEIEKRKHFTEEDAAVVISQLLSAIIYCHERHIVHRDIKPENVLLEKTTSDKIHLKVIDFGTAQIFNSLKKLTTTTGTAYYIAPEVLKKNYDKRCDVWSCGVILYILLSGTPPFNGNTDDEILKAIKKAKFEYRGK